MAAKMLYGFRTNTAAGVLPFVELPGFAMAHMGGRGCGRAWLYESMVQAKAARLKAKEKGIKVGECIETYVIRKDGVRLVRAEKAE